MKKIILVYVSLLFPLFAQADMTKKGIDCVVSVDDNAKEIYYTGAGSDNDPESQWRVEIKAADIKTEDGVALEGDVELLGIYIEEYNEMLHSVKVGNIVTRAFVAVEDGDRVAMSKGLPLNIGDMSYAISCMFIKQDAE